MVAINLRYKGPSVVNLFLKPVSPSADSKTCLADDFTIVLEQVSANSPWVGNSYYPWTISIRPNSNI